MNLRPLKAIYAVFGSLNSDIVLENRYNIKVTTQPTLPQVMTESIYWFEYPVETRFYVKTSPKPAGG